MRSPILKEPTEILKRLMAVVNLRVYLDIETPSLYKFPSNSLTT